MGQIDFKLPDVASAAKANVAVEFMAGEKHFQNDWTAWLYPAAIKPDTHSTAVFADQEQIKKIPNWDLKPLPAQGPLSDRAMYVVSVVEGGFWGGDVEPVASTLGPP
jgi:hypothetical protein